MKAKAAHFLLSLLLIFIFTSGTKNPAGNLQPHITQNNPLLPGPQELFDFARVDTTAIKAAALQTETDVKKLVDGISAVNDSERTYENTMLPLDDVYNILQKATSVYELLVNTSPDKSIRDMSGAMLEKFTSVTDELMLNEALYKAVKAYAALTSHIRLKQEQYYFVKKTLHEFELNGMTLAPADRDTLMAVNSRINALSVEFGKNIAGDKTKVNFAAGELSGLPDDFKKTFLTEVGNYSFDLSTPTYTTFMMLCSNTAARKKMYIAKMNVGGEKNEQLLVDIIKLRTRKAQLLGFKTYSQYATSDIMSQNTDNVWKFEKDLAADLRPKAQDDLKQLLAIKGGNSDTIYPYEAGYYTNELMKKKYNIDGEKVKEYFEMKNVIKGIFTVYQKLYNLNFVEDKHPSVWQKDVKAFSVFDNATHQRIGYFYLDLYPRDNKYNHFGCFSLTGSKTFSDGKTQLRSAALVCNFPAPTADKPSLLPHGTVVTFFHEFGHLIHVMLSNTQLAVFAGTNVATDFVEAPSQMMENWAWQKNVLSLFAKHYKTGAVIPDSLLNSMIAARNVNSGLNTLQQVYYGTLDFTLNDGFSPASSADIVAKTKELQNSITFYPWIPGTHFAGSFGHLTGYGSKYYGYLWSLVYAADMFSEFQKEGVLSPQTGKRYRDCVLSKGGSDDAIHLVKNFLGREPNNTAFMKLIGLEAK